MSVQVQCGRYYLNDVGEICGPMLDTGDPEYPVQCAATGKRYTSLGKYRYGFVSSRDLVLEIPDPGPIHGQPVERRCGMSAKPKAWAEPKITTAGHLAIAASERHRIGDLIEGLCYRLATEQRAHGGTDQIRQMTGADIIDALEEQEATLLTAIAKVAGLAT
jgi:hypothetical protein